MPEHVNIFARKPVKSVGLPAKRYEPWISVFERLVSEAQKKVTELSKKERLYNVLKEFLELQGLPNQTTIDIGVYYTSIKIHALPTNTQKEIIQFNDRLCEHLNKHRFREGETPGIGWGCAYDHDVTCYFSVTDGAVVSCWKIPADGIADMEVQTIREEVTRYETSYKIIPRVKGITDETVR